VQQLLQQSEKNGSNFSFFPSFELSHPQKPSQSNKIRAGEMAAHLNSHKTKT